MHVTRWPLPTDLPPADTVLPREAAYGARGDRGGFQGPDGPVRTSGLRTVPRRIPSRGGSTTTPFLLGDSTTSRRILPGSQHELDGQGWAGSSGPEAPESGLLTGDPLPVGYLGVRLRSLLRRPRAISSGGSGGCRPPIVGPADQPHPTGSVAGGWGRSPSPDSGSAASECRTAPHHLLVLDPDRHRPTLTPAVPSSPVRRSADPGHTAPVSRRVRRQALPLRPLEGRGLAQIVA